MKYSNRSGNKIKATIKDPLITGNKQYWEIMKNNISFLGEESLDTMYASKLMSDGLNSLEASEKARIDIKRLRDEISKIPTQSQREKEYYSKLLKLIYR